MILHFVGGKTSDDLSIIKETKKYIVFRCHDNTMKYRYNKETGEVEYHYGDIVEYNTASRAFTRRTDVKNDNLLVVTSA